MWKAVHYLGLGVIVCVAIGRLAGWAVAASQPGLKIYTNDSGEIFMMPEIGAIIVAGDEDVVKVEIVQPKEHRVKPYKTVDLEPNDVIMMVNGKRVTSIEKLQELYDLVEVGGDVKMGVKRGERIFLVSFPKADESKMPQRRMMVMSTEGDSTMAGSGGSGPVTRVMKIGGSRITGNGAKKSPADIMILKSPTGQGRMILLPDLGLMMEEKDDVIQVSSVSSNVPSLYQDEEPALGDVLMAIQGKPITNADQMKKEYQKIEDGTEVHFTFRRSKEEIDVSFIKREAEKNVKIIEK